VGMEEVSEIMNALTKYTLYQLTVEWRDKFIPFFVSYAMIAVRDCNVMSFAFLLVKVYGFTTDSESRTQMGIIFFDYCVLKWPLPYRTSFPCI